MVVSVSEPADIKDQDTYSVMGCSRDGSQCEREESCQRKTRNLCDSVKEME